MEEKLKLNAAQEKFFKNIVEHLDRSPEEVKRALNINRQQRKQYLKEQEKKLRAVKNLTPIQISIMKEVVDKEKEKSQNTVAEYTVSLYSSVNSVLYSDFNFNGDESVKLWEKVENILDEDKAARKELSKISQEEWRKMEQQVNEFIKKELEQGKKQKEIIEELKKKFPKLSTAMRVNAVKEVKAINRDEAKNIATSWEPCEEEVELKFDAKEFENQMEKVRQIANDTSNNMVYEKKASAICQDKEGVVCEVKGILEQLREQQEFREQKVQKANKELEELEKLITAKKEEIDKTEEEIGRIEEALAVLGPVNI